MSTIRYRIQPSHPREHYFTVQCRLESPDPPRFMLTGSSARKLRRGAANLLAGRLVQAQMHPFTAAELGAHFDLARALRIGLLPLVWNAALGIWQGRWAP